MLAQLLNAAQRSVAVGGTSGKSTVTGMIGWILHACHRQPTVMNGAVMKNFVSPAAPFASALVGDPELFVSEVDESDGSIALYRPTVAVLTNISLDHHGDGRAARPVRRLPRRAPARRWSTSTIPRPARWPTSLRDPLGYGFDSPGAAAFVGRDLELGPDGCAFTVDAGDDSVARRAAVPGRHNASNALAALAAVAALGVPLADAAAALGRFAGLKRRLETVGTAGGVTVIDDFAHNPDKIAATLATLTAQPGRLLVMFQPHGFGPLAKMGDELAETFADGLRDGDRLFLPDPVYQGGTVDRRAAPTGSPRRSARAAATPTTSPTRAAIGTRLARRSGEPATASSSWARATTRSSEFAADLLAVCGTSPPAQCIIGPWHKPGTVIGWKLDREQRSDAAAAASRRATPEAVADHVTLETEAAAKPLPRPVDAAIVGRADDGERGRGDGRRGRRHHRPPRRLDLPHHLVARPRPQGAREQ